MKRTVKKVIDVILGLLFLLLLGYSFTGGQLHEILGVIFFAGILIHNILNKRWYAALKKGMHGKWGRFTAVVNIALLIDTAAIVVTGVINSRFLFDTGIRISIMGQIHTILALVGLVLIVSHIWIHVFSHTKKKNNKLLVIFILFTSILAVVLYTWFLPYVRRHFYTVKINREEVVSGEHVDFNGGKVLTVYFTRVGNTNFEDDVDVVSGASLLINEKDELMGNSQIIAQMIRDAVGGDIISINVENKYPSAYSDTVSVASDEMGQEELPALVDMPESIADYDTIFLVYPLWWWTIPKPVEAFLTNYDFTGKTVIPAVTHGGSGAGNSIKDIQLICNGIVVEEPLEVYCGDIPDSREHVTKWLENLPDSDE